MTLSDKEEAIVNAARNWVHRIVDPPSLWADDEDFALIEAVAALDSETGEDN